MALGRKFLSAMGIEAEQIDQIIQAHSETVNGLKDEISKLQDKLAEKEKDTDELKEVKKELSDLQKKVEAEAKEREGKDYDALLKQFNDYKAEQEKKELEGKKKTAFEKLLKDMKMSEKGMEMIFKWQGVGSVELDEDGKISNAKDLRKSIKDDWGEYIEADGKQGADTDNPPGNGNDKTGTYQGMSKDDIMKIKDDTERQTAIAENHELFGF